MGPVTHQTVKLSRGKHTSNERGACVMELASMLAGEPFSDHPKSVCPLIGGLLRAYNDRIDDERRQDLYVYASKVVGSRGSQEVERRRAERLSAWIATAKPRRGIRSLFAAGGLPVSPSAPAEALGAEAVRSLHRYDDGTHAQMLRLVDELLALGSREQTVPGETSPSVARQVRAGC